MELFSTAFLVPSRPFYGHSRLQIFQLLTSNFSLKFANIQFSKPQKVNSNKIYDFFLIIFYVKYSLVPKSLDPTGQEFYSITSDFYGCLAKKHPCKNARVDTFPTLFYTYKNFKKGGAAILPWAGTQSILIDIQYVKGPRPGSTQRAEK
jgi:hypothetical protein